MASAVIGLFDKTIEHLVALAALMPIVASMGGNAGTQTMTVTVRALAARDLDVQTATRLVRREVGVAVTNGLLFAVIVGATTSMLFQDYHLGIIMGVALMINLLAAALAGNFIPQILNRFGADPAVASTVFVTTVTDMTGFFGFLGLATLWYGLK
jgi:magnesium transporter